MFVFKGFGSRCPLCVCVCRTFSYAMRYSRTIRRILRIICLWFMSEGVPIGTAMVHHLVATDLWSAGSPDHCFTICVILADLQLSPGRVCALLRTFAATMTINCRRCLMAFPTCQNFSQVVEDHDTLSSTLSLDFGSVLAPMEHTPLSGQGDSGGHAYDMFFSRTAKYLQTRTQKLESMYIPHICTPAFYAICHSHPHRQGSSEPTRI